MRIVVAGGHGQVALRLERLLAEQGHEVVGIVRKPAQVADLEDVGARAVVLDLESTSVDDLAAVVRDADAVVFAAGGGPDGNVARKWSVDKGAAVMLADAAEATGVRRYVMVSSMRTETADPASADVFQVYLRAKQEADDDLRARDLDWTVVKPGRLTDAAGTGRVSVGSLERGEISRDDVAAVLAAVLADPGSVHQTFDVLAGDVPVAEAVASL